MREDAPGKNQVRVRKVDSRDEMRWTLATRPSSSAGGVWVSWVDAQRTEMHAHEASAPEMLMGGVE